MTDEKTSSIVEKLAEAQKRMKNPKLDKVNPRFRSGYASLASILECVRPALNEQGLFFTQSVSIEKEGRAVVTTKVKDGCTTETLDKRPIRITGDPQKDASAETYAKRYAICTVFGIVGDEDDDGNAAEGGSRNQHQQAQQQPAQQAKSEQRLGQIAESVEFPSGEEERRAAEKRLRGMFVEGKQAGFDLKGFHAYARQAHGCDYLQMTTDQLTACADEFKRRLDRFQQASGEVEHVWE